MSNDVILWIGGIIATGIFGLIGWVITMIFNAIKEQRDDHTKLKDSLQNHKLHAAENFVTKFDMTNFVERVMGKLEKIDEKFDVINDKLDKKADKSDV